MPGDGRLALRQPVLGLEVAQFRPDQLGRLEGGAERAPRQAALPRVGPLAPRLEDERRGEGGEGGSVEAVPGAAPQALGDEQVAFAVDAAE